VGSYWRIFIWCDVGLPFYQKEETNEVVFEKESSLVVFKNLLAQKVLTEIISKKIEDG